MTGSGTPTGKRTAETYPGDSVRTPTARESPRGKHESAGVPQKAVAKLETKPLDRAEGLLEAELHAD